MDEDQSDNQVSLKVIFAERKGCTPGIPDAVMAFMEMFASQLIVGKCGTVANAKAAFDQHRACAYPGDTVQVLMADVDHLMLECLAPEFGPTAAKSFIPLVSFEGH